MQIQLNFIDIAFWYHQLSRWTQHNTKQHILKAYPIRFKTKTCMKTLTPYISNGVGKNKDVWRKVGLDKPREPAITSQSHEQYFWWFGEEARDMHTICDTLISLYIFSQWQFKSSPQQYHLMLKSIFKEFMTDKKKTKKSNFRKAKYQGKINLVESYLYCLKTTFSCNKT